MQKSLVSNPPYNMAWEIPALAGFITQYAGYTIPPKSNANYAFMLTALSAIDGRAVFLLPNSVLTSEQKDERSIRSQFVEENLISAIIALPDSMFESTQIPVCIVVFEKNKKTTKIEMIDMRDRYDIEVREQKGQFGGNSKTNRTYRKEVKTISEKAMLEAVDAINNNSDIKGFAKPVLPNEIRQQAYDLQPSRYIEKGVENAIAHRDFADISDDYNRVIRAKNAIKIRMNKTVAKRLGYDCMDHERVDLSKSFEVVGQKAEKENNITFSADDGIRISISTKDGVHPLVLEFLKTWRLMMMHLNNEENRYLAEFRDALLEKLMSGEVELNDRT